MIIVPVKENESIDRALKKFKKKFERTALYVNYAPARLLKRSLYPAARSSSTRAT
jgi:ribosomal protein S21